MKHLKPLLAKAILFSLVAFQLNSCTKDDEHESFYPKYLHEYQEIKSLTKEQIQALHAEGSLLPPEATMMINLGVKGYEIVYKTIDPDGQNIFASGALLVPVTSTPMPMLSLQHGTILNQDDAPSNFTSTFNDMGIILSSMGYIIAIPDYIGYGASADIPHPYEHRLSIAISCRDMLRASIEFFKKNSMDQPNDKLFLSGYSEGGFATMATFKLLQEEHANEFNITAVTVGAGAYNKTAFVDWVLNSTGSLEYINYFVWVLDAYNSIYPTLNRPSSYYFNEPWASIIENQGVFAEIEGDPSVLFTETFIQGVKNGTDADFLDAIADNNCYSWKPQSPLRLYHGDNDTFVPYFNSETAYNSMINLGANNVELITIENGTHETSINTYLMGSFYFFRNFLFTKNQ